MADHLANLAFTLRSAAKVPGDFDGFSSALNFYRFSFPSLIYLLAMMFSLSRWLLLLRLLCFRLLYFSRRISSKRCTFLRYSRQLSFSPLDLRLFISVNTLPKLFSPRLRSENRCGYRFSMKCLRIKSRYASVASLMLSSVSSLISPLKHFRSLSLKNYLK